MTGFLHRIAQRALGAGVTVHSRARLPYAPQPVLAEPTAEVPAPRRAAQSFSGEGRVMIPAFKAERLDAAAPPQDQPLHPPARETAARETEANLPGETAMRPPRRPRPQEMAGTLRNTSTLPARSEAAGTVSPMPADAGNTPLVALRLTEPLLPRPVLPAPVQPAPGLRAVGPGPADHSADRQPKLEETTEVHVSIGRIEVTAVHEAPAPRRAPPAAARAMSLEEYLARKRGGRP